MTGPADGAGPGKQGRGLSNLMQRLLTAVVLIPILCVSMFVDPTSWSILAFSTVAMVLAADEFLRMAMGGRGAGGSERAGGAWGLRVTFAIAGAGVVVSNTVLGTSTAMAPISFAATMLIAAAVLVRKQHLADAGHTLSYALAGLLYVPMLGCVWPLLKHDFGPQWLFLALALAFSSDTLAYFAGRGFGKHKLYEAVSPKKTIEGSIGGLFGGMLAMVGFGHYWLAPELPIVHAVVLGVIGSVLGQLGDLVESMIKRTFGVKDSGNVLPGHGGMLDRVDGLLFVAPLVYYYAKLF
jgi:phosphatidate cytidylyltransferase